MTVAAPPFVRDGKTRLAYGGLSVYAYALYALGPLLPLLRHDFRLSYSMMSAHSTVFAAGAILANALIERLTGAFGYRRVFWTSLGTLVLGAALLAVGPSVAVTLSAAAVMGVSGALVQTTVLAVLAQHHGPLRERAIVEANAGASAAALVAPLVIGACQAAGVGWSPSMLLPLVIAGGLYLTLGQETLRPRRSPTGEAAPAGRLPAAYWLLAALAGVVVGAEFCLVFYGSPQLTSSIGLTDGQAATAMSLFYGGELLGRLAGSRLSATRATTTQLVLVSLAVTVVGFLLLWTSGSTVIALAALLVTGLGIANLFPLTLSLAVAAARGRTDQATARVQLIVAVSIMLAPLILGTLSDHFGVRRSFAVEGVLLTAAVVLLLLGTAARRGRPARVELQLASMDFTGDQ
ncbi:MFS transporter [Kitasatospora sp. NPDC008050]|uniref:MFS transporter n=1 Tax=Kitasatospora sp. NPDC008050 TaxID=3364021 RepID=UPI0036EC7725